MTFTDAGILTQMLATLEDLGTGDTITLGEGDNVAIAGQGDDTVTSGSGEDVVLGDSGVANFDSAGVLTDASSTAMDQGGDDVIDTGNGDSYVIGGYGTDTVTGGIDNDMVIGDNGSVELTAGVVTFIESTDLDDSTGGNDVIDVGDGENQVNGGVGSDTVTGGDDSDYVLGDHGSMTFTDAGILTQMLATLEDLGAGADISLGGGDNVAIAGQGDDVVTAGAGDDVLLGDSGVANFDSAGVLTDASSTAMDQGGDDTIDTGNGDSYVIGGYGTDTVTGGIDNDMVIGDNGSVELTAGVVTFIESTDLDDSTGSSDVIDVGDGENKVIGGVGSDTVTGGDDSDYVLGDHGSMTFTDAGILTQMTSSLDSLGTGDTITLGEGDNVAIAGQGDDTVTSGSGEDVVLGDSGVANFDSAGVLTDASSASPDQGGDDTIETGDNNDMVIGGYGDDIIEGGDGNDILLGDDGVILRSLGLPAQVSSTSPSIGGDDVIVGGNGDDVLIGGSLSDTLLGGAGFDILFGDDGIVLYSKGWIISAETIPSSKGASDYLDGGEGTNILFGGEGTDAGIGTFPVDALIGEYGKVIIESNKIVSIFPPVQMLFGNPMNGSDKFDGADFPGVGPVFTQGVIFTEAGSGIIAIGTPGKSGFDQVITHHASYAQTGAGGQKSLEGYILPEDLERGRAAGGVVTEFVLPDGSIERRFSDGTVETTRPDGTVIMKMSDGTVMVRNPDGTTIMTSPDGTRTATLPDGTVIQTLTDGTIITTTPDGRVIRTSPDGTTEITQNNIEIQSSIIKKLFDMDMNVWDPEEGYLQSGSEFDISLKKIELGSIIAGVSGWGLASSNGKGSQARLDTEGFRKLQRDARSRKFIRWQGGRFFKAGEDSGYPIDRKKLH
ncbi:MAG: hypothetical protein PHH09_12815 [Methanoregulaceae archaeon]|nr:hypothetical protein [Methanoregulaceae archaeon]